MVRRDEFITKVSQLNNLETLNRELQKLEEYVDKQLISDENILKFINDNVQGNSDTQSSFLEIVDKTVDTNAIHRYPNAISPTLKKSEGIYKVWAEDLKDKDGTSLTTKPQIDKTLHQELKGELRIDLPKDTNKNVAHLLLEKYLDKDIDSGGFWSVIVKGDTGTTMNITEDNNMVKLIHDRGNDVLYFKFKLFN